MGGFCPICKIYWGEFCPSKQKRVCVCGGGGGGGDSVRGDFVWIPLNAHQGLALLVMACDSVGLAMHKYI